MGRLLQPQLGREGTSSDMAKLQYFGFGISDLKCHEQGGGHYFNPQWLPPGNQQLGCLANHMIQNQHRFGSRRPLQFSWRGSIPGARCRQIFSARHVPSSSGRVAAEAPCLSGGRFRCVLAVLPRLVPRHWGLDRVPKAGTRLPGGGNIRTRPGPCGTCGVRTSREQCIRRRLGKWRACWCYFEFGIWDFGFDEGQIPQFPVPRSPNTARSIKWQRMCSIARCAS